MKDLQADKKSQKDPPILRLVYQMLLENREMFSTLWWVVPLTLIVVGAQLAEPYIYKLIIDNIASV